MKTAIVALVMLLPLYSMAESFDTTCSLKGGREVVLKVHSASGQFSFESPGDMRHYADTKFRRILIEDEGAVFQWVNQSGIWGNGFRTDVLQVYYGNDYKAFKAEYILHVDKEILSMKLDCRTK